MLSDKKRKIFIITGMSGAGKSQALKVFEDFGFYCVDNLPLALFPEFVELIHKNNISGDIALGLDIRGGKAIKGVPAILAKIKKGGLNVKVVFFDAEDSVLLHRFSETRHRHPLGKNLAQAVKQERRMLVGLKALANREINTSKMTLGELKENLSLLLELKRSQEMKLSVVSFGYKYGIPLDADLVMDVRFLSNPYYIKRLKKKTGLDKAVAEYILEDSKTAVFLRRYADLIKYLLPFYMKEGKSYMSIAIGCTGGKHRSVFIAHMLAEILKEAGFNVSEFHKDIRKQ